MTGQASDRRFGFKVGDQVVYTDPDGDEDDYVGTVTGFGDGWPGMVVLDDGSLLADSACVELVGVDRATLIERLAGEVDRLRGYIVWLGYDYEAGDQTWERFLQHWEEYGPTPSIVDVLVAAIDWEKPPDV